MFNALENFITATYGEEVADKIFEESQLKTKDPFVGPGTYPDDDFHTLIRVTMEELKLTKDELMFDFGKFTFTELRTRFPKFVEKFTHPKDFLKTVEDIIHVEVKKVMQDAYLPKFQYTEPSDRELTITYFSKRKMYKLMEGIIEGVAEYFQVNTHQKQNIYEIDGQEYCDFYLRFDK